MNTELTNNAKKDFEKKNFYFGKIAFNDRRNYLLSEPNYHRTKNQQLATEMKITRIIMNKLVYLGLSTLDMS